MLAIASCAGDNTTKERLLAQRACDQSAFYPAKVTRRRLLAQGEIIRYQGTLTHNPERWHMDTLPAELRQGVEEFNRAFFFEAHETLEDLWRGTSGPLRLFYQGLIQLAVALYHLSNGNRRGALNLLSKSLDKLVAFQPTCQNIDVDALCREARVWLDRVRQAGHGEVTVDTAQLPRIRWLASERNSA